MNAHTPPLVPNKAEISTHLYALFGAEFVQAYPDAWIEIAYGRPDGKLNAAKNFSAFDLEKAVACAESKNKAGYNVYVGTALRHGAKPDSGRANGDHVLDASHAWAEYDGVGDDERIGAILKANNLAPALVVTTGTMPHVRRHLYFKLNGTVTPEKLEAANKSLIALFSSDDVWNSDRIMRLAGTVSYPSPKKAVKGYVPELVTLASHTEARAYSAEDLIKLAPDAPSDNSYTEYGKKNGKQKGRTDDQLTELLEASKIDSKWWTSMRSAVATMIGRGWSDSAIKLVCAPYCDDGANDADLKKLIDTGRGKFEKSDTEGTATLPLGYSFSDRGLMWQDPNSDGDESKPPMHIAGNFDVAAMARNSDGNSWGLLLKWKDPDGRDHSYVLQRELLAGDGLEARKVLTGQGFYIAPNPGARAKFNAFLLQVKSPNRALSTESVGWNGDAFVLPDECIGGNTGETLLLQNATQDHPFKQSGTLEEWQQEVARLAAGNSRLVLAISMAFVGPLLGPCSEEGGGIHLKGSSSIGKTTALYASGSVWGKGGANGYVKSWRATANGLEGTCLNHSDTFLCLDEMAQISARDAGEAAYMMANGSGKSRSRTDGSARKTAKFRVMFLSSARSGSPTRSRRIIEAGSQLQASRYGLSTSPLMLGRSMAYSRSCMASSPARLCPSTSSPPRRGSTAPPAERSWPRSCRRSTTSRVRPRR
jgi:hypothetical protein